MPTMLPLFDLCEDMFTEKLAVHSLMLRYRECPGIRCS